MISTFIPKQLTEECSCHSKGRDVRFPEVINVNFSVLPGWILKAYKHRIYCHMSDLGNTC